MQDSLGREWKESWVSSLELPHAVELRLSVRSDSVASLAEVPMTIVFPAR